MTVCKIRPLVLAGHLARRGYVYLLAAQIGHVGTGYRDLAELWANLIDDPSFHGEGFSRRRRYARVRAGSDGCVAVHLTRLPHEDFVQAATENALYHGVARRFGPCVDALLQSPAMLRLLGLDLSVVASRMESWEISLHQVRVGWAAGAMPASTAPEGLHNDGHRFIAMHMVTLNGSSAGGVSLIFSPAEREKPLFSARLSVPGDTLIIDDRRVLHEITPIVPSGSDGYRDMLIIDFRQPVTDDSDIWRTGTAEAVAVPGEIT